MFMRHLGLAGHCGRMPLRCQPSCQVLDGLTGASSILRGSLSSGREGLGEGKPAKGRAMMSFIFGTALRPLDSVIDKVASV
jgi:hypothetical protein